jgi:DNA-binding response OmpR family regulator
MPEIPMPEANPNGPEANPNGQRIGLLGFPVWLAEMLSSALKSAEYLASNLSRTSDDPLDPLEGYDVLIVWPGIKGSTPRVAELAATSQPWLLFGTEERIRQDSALYLRADDIVFTPYSLSELLFRIDRTIQRVSIGSQDSSKRQKPAVLVVDDDPAMLALLRVVLRNSGWECHFATSGRQALLMVRKLLPDLLVLDIDMPFMTGLEVLRRVRETQADRLKVLLLTACGDLKNVEEGLSLGADGYLAKPFSHVALVHRVRTLLFSTNEALQASRKQYKLA